MSSQWNDPDRERTPDSELESLARLYREFPPPEPSAAVWQQVLARTEARLALNRRRHLHYWPMIAGLIAASLCGAALLARSLWPVPVSPQEPVAQVVLPVDEEEPFEVVALGEINIHGMDPSDADRVVLGQPLLGSMEFVFPEDIDLVHLDSDRKVRRKPRLHRDVGVPMIIVARADTDAAEDEGADAEKEP